MIRRKEGRKGGERNRREREGRRDVVRLDTLYMTIFQDHLSNIFYKDSLSEDDLLQQCYHDNKGCTCMTLCRNAQILRVHFPSIHRSHTISEPRAAEQ